MDGAAKWGFAYYTPKRVSSFYSDNGILSMRQPGWDERFEELEREDRTRFLGILTIRHQKELAKTLCWDYDHNSDPSTDKHHHAVDPVTAWNRFIDDLKRGRERRKLQKQEELMRRRQHRLQQKQKTKPVERELQENK